LWTDGFRSIDRLKGFSEKHGDEGLRILLLFKLIRAEVRAEIQRQYQGANAEFDELKLAKVCLEKAQQLAIRGKSKPTIDDIRSVLRKLT
jgi:hypothetical protein